MPQKSKMKILKKIEKKTERKASKKTVSKTTKASAVNVNRATLPSTGKIIKTNENNHQSQSTLSATKSPEVIEEGHRDIPFHDGSRKRSSNDSILATEEPAKPPPSAKKLRLAEEDPLQKTIDEIEMASSSSEVDFSEYHRQSSSESFIIDAGKLLETAAISDEEDSESTVEDVPDYLKQNELEEIPDFFGNFGDVPEVDDVSLDLTLDIVVKEKQPRLIDQMGPLDMGKFVNPLTGESTSSEVSSQDQFEVNEKVVLEAIAESRATEEEASDQGSIDIPVMSDQEMEVEIKLVDEEDTFNQFLELEAQGAVEVFEEIDLEARAREENARLLLSHTHEFVRDLIDRAVEKAEYVDPKVILRQNLDKRKLMKELQEKLAVLEVERRGKQFLNRKCVEYFRRKRSFRPLLDDNPKTLNQEMRKYQAAVNSLDQLLIKEDEARTLTQHNLAALREELGVAEERAQDEIVKLEEMIRKTLKRENFDKLQMVVSNSLNKMNAIRKEISQVRFQLIQKQHSMATLVDQLRDLEDLGNGLSMRNFETIQTETQALGKKIEERNSELSKLRYRCHGDIHRMAHLKEKQKMLRDTILFQRQYMEELQTEKQRLREDLFKLKITRSQLRKDMRDISFQSGLLDKPVLMKDYDTTVEYLEDLRKRVNQSKATISHLNEKISILENHCDLKTKSSVSL